MEFVKYVFVENGRSDKRLAMLSIGKQLKALEEEHRKNSLPPLPPYEEHLTTSAADTSDFVVEYCRTHPDETACFVACGGDGTLNNVVTGILHASQNNKSFAVLAYGTGNDFVRYYPQCNFHSVAALFNSSLQYIDALKITSDAQPHKTFYSLNVTNFGFDAIACNIANRLSHVGVKHTYTLGVVSALLKGTRNRIEVEVDGEKIGGKRLLLCTLSNCKFVGGGYRCAPRADNADGLIELCYVRPMSLPKMLSLLRFYRKGLHLDHPRCSKRIIYRQCHQAIVKAKNTIKLCIDGEMLPGRNFSIKILNGILPLRVPGLA